ncbi:DUF998 domain-containing protein [Nocardia wallacei]|uniref:DUF998 domain-containing protein n=1 Tax=Nocardia wallacei TaxID=480035 RepID=UPI0024540F27|nr:DUF998 domain-containing protein [Nocardia wallacei]
MTPDERRWKRVLRWCIAPAIALAGVCYSSWVLEFVLPVGLDPVTSFLSQLDEEGRPYRWVFSTGDTLTGMLALAAAAGGLLAFSRRRLSTVGWVALGCFGAATIADARWPLQPCADNCDKGLFPQLHQVHALTSTLAVTSIFVAMIAFSAAAFRYRRWPILRHSGLWILGIAAVATAWMLIADNLPGDYALGIAQRIQVGAISVWLLALAAQIRVADRISGGGRARRPASAGPTMPPPPTGP